MPAPEIQPTLCRFNLWHAATEENPVKRVRKQVDFGSDNAPKSSRFTRRHKVPRDSLCPHQKFNRPLCRFNLWYAATYSLILSPHRPKQPPAQGGVVLGVDAAVVRTIPGTSGSKTLADTVININERKKLSLRFALYRGKFGLHATQNFAW